jgi:aldose 1-epimerase
MKFATPESTKSTASRMRRWSASGWMTPCLLGILGLGLIIASYEHTRGNLHKLRQTVTTKTEGPIVSSGPGGQDPVILTRHLEPNDSEPEFLSATLLPGRGFNLWQLTAHIPGHGNVSLLASPPVANAASLLASTGADANGSASTNFGAAFLAPWAGQMAGSPAPGAGVLQTEWQGERLAFPSSIPGSSLSVEGLLLDRGADDLKVTPQPDGELAQATFHAGSFGGSWPGNTDITILVQLSGHTVDLTVTAQNIGTVAEPFGIGWHPFFAIPTGPRAAATLVIPSTTRLSAPNARTRPSTATQLSYDDSQTGFFRAGGTKLGDVSLDESYIDLHAGVLADGPIAELRDPAAGYGVRVTPLSNNVKTFRVIAPADKSWVSIGPNMNIPDPLGLEWKTLDSNGMVTLQPGDSVQWKVRLEIFSVPGSTE